MRNSVTKILSHHLSLHPHLADLPYTTKDLVGKLITDHSNHLLVMALAAAAIEHVDWQELEQTIEAIKLSD